MATRPFYVIAHRCNDFDSAKEAIKAGANAIECDLHYNKEKKAFVVSHDSDSYSVESALTTYLDKLRKQVKNNSKFALLYFDCKDQPTNQIIPLIQLVRAHLTNEVPVNVIFSIAEYKNRAFFNPLKDFTLWANEGVAIDYENDYQRNTKFFQKLGITHHAYGNGVDVKVSDLFAPNVPHTVMNAVASRALHHQIKFVYVWTLEKRDSMRNYLRMGVDGIMVNDPAKLRKVVKDKEFSGKYRLATRNDRPFTTTPPSAYVLRVKTADVGSAGTDAWLRFAVVGPTGAKLRYLIDSYPPGLFEADNVNYVTIFGDVGTPKKLRVWRDDKGNAPGWYLDRIGVTKTKGSSPAMATKTVVFDQWIPEDEVVVKVVA